MNGHGTPSDLNDIEQWGNMMVINRCGLGHTAANPILTSLNNFREIYESKINQTKKFDSGIDLFAAVVESCEFVDRIPHT